MSKAYKNITSTKEICLSLVIRSGGGMTTSSPILASSPEELRQRLMDEKVNRFDIRHEPGMFDETLYGSTVRSDVHLNEIDDSLFAFLAKVTNLLIVINKPLFISLPVDPGGEVVAMYIRGRWVPVL